MREKLNYFCYGVLFGIYISGATVGAIVDRATEQVHGAVYNYREWRREREIKKKQKL